MSPTATSSTVTVILIGPSGDEQKVALPTDKKVHDICDAVRRKYNWPKEDSSGKKLKVILQNKGTGKDLAGHQTLAEQNVKDQDILRARQEAKPGMTD
jgi:hypothetical protein